jgi:hypothetical protein
LLLLERAVNEVPTQTPLLTGLFRDRQSAQSAYEAAVDRGYGVDEVNLVMSDATRERHFAGAASEAPPDPSIDAASGDAEGDDADEGAGIGAGLGGALGAVVASVAAIGTGVSLPGLGLVLSGPLSAALAGTEADGAAAGVLGGLVGWGLPQEQARVYEAGLHDGAIVMGLQPRSLEDADHLARRWQEVGGEDLYR